MAPPERDVEVVWEIEPPLHADVAHLHAQLDSEASAPGPRPAGGVTPRLRRIPEWKLTADRLFVQVSYDLEAPLPGGATTTHQGAPA